MAQLGERLNGIEEVGGSSPPRSIIINNEGGTRSERVPPFCF